MQSTPWGQVVLITGAMAAGKSTVAALLAERLPMSVHLRGDLFRRMIVRGRADMTSEPTDEALRQLRLRYALAARVTLDYAEAGFDVVVQDIVLGADLTQFLADLRCPHRRVVVLCPDVATLERREAQRRKTGYGEITAAALDAELREQTPRIGLWLDTSRQTPAETVAEILRRWDDARV